MTKKQAERYAYLLRALDNLGVSKEDADALLRIERTLHRWAERECNGEVETDDDGKAWRLSAVSAHRFAIPNREAGALRRLKAIMARYPALAAYHQTDPRGCALYIAKREAIGQRNLDECYSSVGVAVCYT